MKRKILRLLTILTLLAVMLSVTALAVSLVHQQENPQAPQNPSSDRGKTLRRIAQERDVEIPDSQRESVVEHTGDLRALVKRAHAIVLGKIIAEESSFTGDDFIDTYFTIDIQRVLKDTDLGELRSYVEGIAPPVQLTTPLKVVRAGGVVYVDGHRASVNIKGRDLVQTGKDYILFLEWSTAYKAFHIIGGVSGAVLVENNRVKPMTSRGELKRQYSEADLETFISDVLQSNQ